MESQQIVKRARVQKIISPMQFVIIDCETSSVFLISLQPAQENNKKSNEVPKNSYFHLLKEISENQVQYSKKNIGNLQIQLSQNIQGSLYLLRNGQRVCIQNLYEDEVIVEPVIQGLQKTVEEILQCFVVKVQGLKLILYVIELGIFISFYFSQLRLVKPPTMYAKAIWQKSQAYYQQTLQGQFVQIKVNGFQKYREQILKRANGQDLKEKIVADGYAQLSKNGEKYLPEAKVQMYQELARKAYENKVGLHHVDKKTKSSNKEIKYVQWEKWYKQKKSLKDLKNGEQQLKKIIEQYKIISTQKSQPTKGRQIIQIFMCLMQENVNKFTMRLFQEFIKILSSALLSVSPSTYFSNQIQNQQFLKYLNKMLICQIFYLTEIEKLTQSQKDKKKNIASNSLVSQIERNIKFVFKICFIGNQTFHQKIFGRKKQNDYESFTFDAPYLKGGISSCSQMSDMEDSAHIEINKNQKKLISMYSKLRMNSTMLLSLVFKIYPSIVQNHWKICVTQNILTQEFFRYLAKMSINAELMKMSNEEKQEIVHLMRTNFGQNSLILLFVFEQNLKVKMNAISCLNNMIVNFQGKKMIDTTQKVYIEKLLKQTKSSFVPKSFIIFCGLRNALYFMLFSLHYEKNIQAIIQIFKALSQLCYHSTLMDKMGFVEGMGLLMKNYIAPVLQFSWQLAELRQLKLLCIGFLGVLVSTQKKWVQIQQQYLLAKGSKNINCLLLDLVQNQRQLSNKKQQAENTEQLNQWQTQKTVVQIIKYFTKLAKRYFNCLFCDIWRQKYSIWKFLCQAFMSNSYQLEYKKGCKKRPQIKHAIIFSYFVEEVYKCHFDELKSLQNSNQQIAQSSDILIQQKSQISYLKIADVQLSVFLKEYILQYSQILTVQNYVSLLNTITYVPYEKWLINIEKEQYLQSQTKNINELEIPQQFILHCFNSMKNTTKEKNNEIRHTKIQQSKIDFPNLDSLKSNSLFRLGLIKLIGYMSFCPAFQAEPFIVEAIKILLECSQSYKSLNSIVKITWGLSNWAKLPNFSQRLTDKQLSQFLEYLILHSRSDKQKIASNSTRGIGFFVNNISKQYDLKKCRQAIINNLSHAIIKVRTNSTKTLKFLAKDLQQKQMRDLVPTLQANLLKNNYHLQTQTLILIKQMKIPITKEKLLLRYSQILNGLNSHSTMEYQLSEIMAIKHLRRSILVQIVELFKDQNLLQRIRKGQNKQKNQHSLQKQPILNEIFESIIYFLQDARQESIRKLKLSQIHNQNLLRRGSERGVQAERQVFNIEDSLKNYDQQKTILTKATLNSLDFTAQEKDISLIQGLKNLGTSLSNQGKDWQHLSNLKIEANNVSAINQIDF